MDNNLTLLLLSKKELDTLKQCGYQELADLNNQVVPVETVYEIKRVLGGIHSRNHMGIKFTRSQLSALKHAGREDYIYLDGKTVGEDLFYEVFDYLDSLRNNSKDLGC